MRFSDTLVAVMVLLRKGNKVLLQKRINTGYMDGYWDFSATGHVEFKESFTEAGVRETLEEIGVRVQKDNFIPMTMMHKFTEESELTYVNSFFFVDEYEGNPKIMEPGKCEALRWFDLDGLPENMIPDRILALELYHQGVFYKEIGW